MELFPDLKRRGKNEETLPAPAKKYKNKKTEEEKDRIVKTKSKMELPKSAVEKLFKIFKCEKAAASGTLEADGQMPFCDKAAKQPRCAISLIWPIARKPKTAILAKPIIEITAKANFILSYIICQE